MRPTLSIAFVLCLIAARPTGGNAGTPIWMLAQSLRGQTLGALPSPSATPPVGPGQQCRAAIAAAERRYGTPPRLLAAIARVESGRRDPGTGQVDPWPWSLNAEGADQVFETKAQAVAAVRSLQASGVRSIDTGCMQVNLMYHSEAFASLEDAFDPWRNADYAARLLVRLRDQTGDWQTATAWYHSATPELGADYQRRVQANLPAEQARVPPLVASAAAIPTGPGPFMLGNRASAARIFLGPGGSGGGRGLDAYRAQPVPIASGVALR